MVLKSLAQFSALYPELRVTVAALWQVVQSAAARS